MFRYDLQGLGGEAPVEDPRSYFFALNEGVCLEAVEDLLYGGEGDAGLDRQFLDLLVVEYCFLNSNGETVSWKILSILSRF
jgi:hypothetical protein